MLSESTIGNREETVTGSKIEYWKQQSELAQRLIADPLGAMLSTPRIWNVFNTPEQLELNAIGCGDEGLGPVVGCRSHMPGAGIIRNPHQLVPQMLAAGIKGIVTHDGCAAAQLAFERHGTRIDEWVAEIERLSENQIKRIRHVTAEEMARPKDAHIATMILVKAMRRISFSKSPLLPLPFNVDGKTCPTYLPEDLLVYLDVAMSSHGFGAFFTHHRPLVIMVIGRNPFSTKPGLHYADLKDSIQWMFRHHPGFDKYRKDLEKGRIVITGFDPPRELIDQSLNDTN